VYIYTLLSFVSCVLRTLKSINIIEKLKMTTYLHIHLPTHLPTHLSVCLSMAVQPSVGPSPLFRFLNPIRSQYDSLDGGSARRKAATCTDRTTQTQKKPTQTSMPQVGLEPTIPAFERAKTDQPQTARPLRSALRMTDFEINGDT
jgi:hypothetical protein